MTLNLSRPLHTSTRTETSKATTPDSSASWTLPPSMPPSPHHHAPIKRSFLTSKTNVASLIHQESTASLPFRHPLSFRFIIRNSYKFQTAPAGTGLPLFLSFRRHSSLESRMLYPRSNFHFHKLPDTQRLQ